MPTVDPYVVQGLAPRPVVSQGYDGASTVVLAECGVRTELDPRDV